MRKAWFAVFLVTAACNNPEPLTVSIDRVDAGSGTAITVAVRVQAQRALVDGVTVRLDYFIDDGNPTLSTSTLLTAAPPEGGVLGMWTVEHEPLLDVDGYQAYDRLEVTATATNNGSDEYVDEGIYHFGNGVFRAPPWIYLAGFDQSTWVTDLGVRVIVNDTNSGATTVSMGFARRVDTTVDLELKVFTGVQAIVRVGGNPASEVTIPAGGTESQAFEVAGPNAPQYGVLNVTWDGSENEEELGGDGGIYMSASTMINGIESKVATKTRVLLPE